MSLFIQVGRIGRYGKNKSSVVVRVIMRLARFCEGCDRLQRNWMELDGMKWDDGVRGVGCDAV